MSPSDTEDDIKKTGVRPEPLCLFCFPEDASHPGRKTYVNSVTREPDARRIGGKTTEKEKEKEEFWLRKRTEARIRRRRMKEPIRNLKSYLLTSVRNERATPNARLPSLFEVLETVTDAWPSPSSRKIKFLRHEDETVKAPIKPEMKTDQISPQLLNRRLSMPEELMRKYSVSKDRTSEESETTKTAIDLSPSSSSTLETARRKPTARPTDPPPPTKADACQQTSDSEDPKTKPKRVTQNDYYKQGKRIIKVKAEQESSTTAKEETDESGTSESLPSSSPTQLPKRESSSGNLSSESDNVRCTCTELSSKETSTDLYLSGKSTLSQTVSDKSVSTQDSTVSINSVSTRGSTVSDNSNSTTSEIERTSAKETTTSPDFSPRTPRNRKNRRRDKTYPRHSKLCPIHSPGLSKPTANASTNTEQLEDKYKWAKLTQEELYMMQQLRHRKFIESQNTLPNPLPPTPDSITTCSGPNYKETERLEEQIMIPRYSALPRSLSMLVNTSSPDNSHNSDSDSLPDSLEDQPVTTVHKLYFDTKRESKPVRGDVNVVEETKLARRQPRGRAFFVSIKQPFGEDEMLESIERIPQPPEKIKNQIFERHLNLCAKHKHLHEPKKKEEKKKSKDEKPKKDTKPRSGPKSLNLVTSEKEDKAKPKQVETTQIVEIPQELNLQKPQAVIHPSPLDPMIPPLLSTLRIPPLRNKEIVPLRRSPIGRFRQRFEVIPEEKSSSLSSAEEKTLPRFTDASTSPLPSENVQFQNCDVIVAKITDENLPYVKGNDSRKIILFSSKQQNSTKGRDALIAMNREDFSRLAKGWMNFYKLNDNLDNSENEEKPLNNPKSSPEKQKNQQKHPKAPDLGDNIRFDSSNTILRPDKPIDSSRSHSLPELKVSAHRNSTSESLRVGKPEIDDTDSDSTDYMEPPSPRVPPLPIDDIPSDATLSSSDTELHPPKPQSTGQTLKFQQFKKRGANTRPKKENLLKKKNSGWSVTVAGTVELSRSAPDLEMRLSFPANGGPPVVSQSDSGFADDSNYSKLSESLQDLDSSTDRKGLPLASGKQKWMVTVKNPKQGNDGTTKLQLPTLETVQGRNPKKVLKDVQLGANVRRLVERKMRAIWPEVQEVIRREFLTESGRLITELEDDDDFCLSVRGSAVSMERKRKPLTMTERDVTRGFTSRTG